MCSRKTQKMSSAGFARWDREKPLQATSSESMTKLPAISSSGGPEWQHVFERAESCGSKFSHVGASFQLAHASDTMKILSPQGEGGLPGYRSEQSGRLGGHGSPLSITMPPSRPASAGVRGVRPARWHPSLRQTQHPATPDRRRSVHSQRLGGPPHVAKKPTQTAMPPQCFHMQAGGGYDCIDPFW